MTNEQAVEKVKELLETGDYIQFSGEDPEYRELFSALLKAKVRSKLKDLVVCTIDKDRTSISLLRKGATVPDEEPSEAAPKTKPKINRASHTYVAPPFEGDIIALLEDEVPHNVLFVGPTGSGKSEEARHLAAKLGRKIFQINGRKDMEAAGFFGDKTVDIDPESGQNYIRFAEGVVVKAMQEGLDENGNEVGPAGVLFIDEFAALPTHLFIGLNHLLETRNPRREVILDGDGGRVVRSHSQFRIICAGNTVGRGLTGTTMAATQYTAQADALDISTLNRFSAVFRFGYNKTAERNILYEKTGDDHVTEQVIQFRDAIRGFIKQNMLATPFSTRDIVAIADLYRSLEDLPKALFYAVFCRLPVDEITVYNEQAQVILGVDIVATHGSQNDQDMDYME